MRKVGCYLVFFMIKRRSDNADGEGGAGELEDEEGGSFHMSVTGSFGFEWC